MGVATVDRLLAEQRRYYRERAPEYDDWWFRRAGYALDTETAARWFADVRELEAALEAFGAGRGDVLELAADRDLDPHPLRHADRVTAVDAVGGGARAEPRADRRRGRLRPRRRLRMGAAARVRRLLLRLLALVRPEPALRGVWQLVGRALKPARPGVPRRQRAARRLPPPRELDRRGRPASPLGRPRVRHRQALLGAGELEREVAAVGWRLRVRTSANGYFISASGTKAR